jgi:hypothetical protein
MFGNSCRMSVRTRDLGRAWDVGRHATGKDLTCKLHKSVPELTSGPSFFQLGWTHLKKVSDGRTFYNLSLDVHLVGTTC